MNTELKGFIQVPLGAGHVVYLRASDIFAIWVGQNDTKIQMNGSPEPQDAFCTPLAIPEVIALIDAAQNG